MELVVLTGMSLVSTLVIARVLDELAPSLSAPIRKPHPLTPIPWFSNRSMHRRGTLTSAEFKVDTGREAAFVFIDAEDGTLTADELTTGIAFAHEFASGGLYLVCGGDPQRCHQRLAGLGRSSLIRDVLEDPDRATTAAFAAREGTAVYMNDAGRISRVGQIQGPTGMRNIRLGLKDEVSSVKNLLG